MAILRHCNEQFTRQSEADEFTTTLEDYGAAQIDQQTHVEGKSMTVSWGVTDSMLQNLLQEPGEVEVQRYAKMSSAVGEKLLEDYHSNPDKYEKEESEDEDEDEDGEGVRGEEKVLADLGRARREREAHSIETVPRGGRYYTTETGMKI